jgi:hypothetical protein
MQHRNPVPHLSGWRQALWLAFLVAASVAFTLGFACAMPFAALGAAGALTLPRRDALLLTGAAWIANQFVGFAVLGYPGTADTIVWGLVLGGVAMLTTFAAQEVVARLGERGVVTVALAGFVGAFAIYEGALFLVSATVMGGTEDFALAIVVRILEINAAAFLGLLALNRLAAAGGLIASPVLSAAPAHRVG